MKTAIEELYANLTGALQRRDAITGDYDFDDAEFESKRDYYLGQYDALQSLVGTHSDYLAELEAHDLSLATIRDWKERGQYEPA
ncbi:hypothetical protein ACFQ5M_13570 [Agrilactobacillus yilanensis]|uniref:Uncharacterized protein n=1 Tax=Agrilactobacillus yilanensis TaxID=2485997 RepID=A0ABW4JBV1_9LACO|nr:hypothetical protein [Agrilactobacillus yilanensis]